MQILYFTIFMIALIVFAVVGLPPREEQFIQDRIIFATHMASWHKAAVRECSTNGCAGLVNVAAILPASMAGAPAFAIPRFETRYDAGSNFLITNVLAGVPASSGLSFTVIMTGLNEALDGESSSIGIFNQATGSIDFTALRGFYTRTSVAIPPALSATIPDGSPVIITDL